MNAHLKITSNYVTTLYKATSVLNDVFVILYKVVFAND